LGPLTWRPKRLPKRRAACRSGRVGEPFHEARGCFKCRSAREQVAKAWREKGSRSRRATLENRRRWRSPKAVHGLFRFLAPILAEQFAGGAAQIFHPPPRARSNPTDLRSSTASGNKYGPIETRHDSLRRPIRVSGALEQANALRQRRTSMAITTCLSRAVGVASGPAGIKKKTNLTSIIHSVLAARSCRGRGPAEVGRAHLVNIDSVQAAQASGES